MLVEGQAQVSMNLTNFRKTPIALVVETIRREAQRYGVGIHHSELVGLIPQDALVDTAVWYTQMDQFKPEQVLEQQLYAALQPGQAEEGETLSAAVEAENAQSSIRSSQFLAALADGSPTPGGGSAAAYASAMGAALVAMVARLTLGKKKYADVNEQMLAILDEADVLRSQLTVAVEEDAAAYDKVMAAFRLPKESEEEKAVRTEAINKATIHAAEVPLETARKSVRIIELASQVAQLGNLNAITDAATGASLAQAALTGAGYNVRINILDLVGMDAELLVNQLEQLEKQATEFNQQLRTTLEERGSLSFG